MTTPSLKRTLIVYCAAIALIAALAAPPGATATSSWTLRQLPPASGDAFGPPLSGISCPTDSLCVAVGGLNTVAFSQAPTGPAAKWQVIHPTYDEPRGSLNGVSCAGESPCVAVGYEGSIYVSTDPAGGADAWSVSDVNEGGRGATHLIGVSCPSPRPLCCGFRRLEQLQRRQDPDLDQPHRRRLRLDGSGDPRWAR